MSRSQFLLVAFRHSRTCARNSRFSCSHEEYCPWHDQCGKGEENRPRQCSNHRHGQRRYHVSTGTETIRSRKRSHHRVRKRSPRGRDHFMSWRMYSPDKRSWLMARRLGLQIRMLAGGAEVLYAEAVWLRGLYLNRRPPARPMKSAAREMSARLLGGGMRGGEGRAL